MEMIDKNKIIEGLECCSTKNLCEQCPYYAGWNEDCVGALSKDVLKLLKQQEQKLVCPKCNGQPKWVTCGLCGQVIKWNR